MKKASSALEFNVERAETSAGWAKKKAVRQRKQGLGSYSSQESQFSDDMPSRKSSRKKTAVSQLGGGGGGGGMIDSIFKGENEG